MFKKQRNILDIGDWAKFSIFWGRLGLSHSPPPKKKYFDNA